ncbi:AraC family transcriptional regulator [Streptomyces sp. H27-D2]|uniref:AraC family transcriptional regulator n=1 Tax=Streptomyces sp. H27-D2 TaxID=3046304 RepID=UPI002DBD96ED|nr:AraC family transcriptional regulator [Streptomyces sp. H27-D2]MEC4018072.1 AraC family transcriptional regulator [Streptomyces sp. H27-D2]
MPEERSRSRITAWRPQVAGVAEVFHAHFVGHAYPAHTHDTWTLMIVDDGCVDFALDRRRHGATGARSTLLLPPGVSHDGRTVTPAGFRKRVLYLDAAVLPGSLVGTAVGAPVLDDALLRGRIDRLHTALGHEEDAFEAESRLAFIRERLLVRLADALPAVPGRGAGRLAAELRELLDARITAGMSLREATAILQAHPTHLIRSFKQTYGLPPHTYLTGRRVDRARRLLLEGRRPAEVAAEAGFYDQAHLSRHFSRHLGITPGRYVSSVRAAGADSVAGAAGGGG